MIMTKPLYGAGNGRKLFHICVIVCLMSTVVQGARSVSALQALAQLRTLKYGSVAEIRKAINAAVPGITYPMFSRIPKTTFSCDDVPQPGFYADTETDCQVYHRCEQRNEYMYSYLCPNQTLFNQILLVCDWWYNVDCSKVKTFYSYSNPRLQHYTGKFLDDEPTTASSRFEGDTYDDTTEQGITGNDFQEDFVADLRELQQYSNLSDANITSPEQAIPADASMKLIAPPFAGNQSTMIHTDANTTVTDTSAPVDGNATVEIFSLWNATSALFMMRPSNISTVPDGIKNGSAVENSDLLNITRTELTVGNGTRIGTEAAVTNETVRIMHNTVSNFSAATTSVAPSPTVSLTTSTVTLPTTLTPLPVTWASVKFRALQPFHVLRNFNDNSLFH
ncbi:uncharacterized protein LOC129585899 [Paramacrobiotus metropolitanus]|uniref:uncharacterized protein LOC129585899 n=1 Tax=Paramacrobiotus metropolitanus TaxID=2943436 RepID=UPI0024460185|nr:uncharacterized protein LOC129585899 [Paramacrobiotus metropolitanus]